MTIAIDFDGTIVEHRYPKIGNEIPFATDTLKMLIKDHHRLILWTVREGELLKEGCGMVQGTGRGVLCHKPGLSRGRCCTSWFLAQR